LGQCFLLGLWGALGGLKTVPRWLLVGLTWIAGTLAFQIANAAPHHWELELGFARLQWEKLAGDILDNLFEALAIGALIISGLNCLLLPLRRLAGWRIDFDPAYYRASEVRRGQVGLMDFAALLCACALPLSLIRLLAGNNDADMGEVLGIPLVMLVFVPTASVAALAVLARRRVLAWLTAAALGMVAMSWCHSWAAKSIDALSMFSTSQTVWGLNPSAILMHGGVFGVVVLTLGSLRLCGLSLITIRGPSTSQPDGIHA
jgi:hypothetical protein